MSMRKTPEAVSKARQALAAEIKVWRAGIAEARRGLALDGTARAEAEQKVDFGLAQLKECRRKMATLRGKKQFWAS